jgi:ribosomal protein S13
MGALKKGDKITTTHPMRLLKGIYGKRNVDGSIRSAHTGVNGIFSSITEKIARRYEGEEGVVVFEIPAGVTVETIKVVQSPESKGVAVSAVRQMETDAINASDAQVVKLITMDSRGEESQYIIKDPALRKIGYKPSEKKALSPEQELKQAFDKWKSETGKLGIVPNWERQIQADIDLFNAAKKYLLTKIGQGAYAFEQFLKDLAKAKVENIDEDRSKWKKFYNDTIKEAAPAEEGKAATPPPPVTPPAAGRAESEGETKERKTITSIKGLEDISEQVKEALFGETTRYTVLPNQVSLNEANAILSAMGEDKAKAIVLDRDENIPDAFRVTLGEVLIKKFNSEGRYDDAVDVATGIANEATGWGQAIQALSLIKFLTPEGQLLAATRTINALRDKRFKAEEGKMNRVKKAFKKADEEAIEGAIDAVVAQTEETPAPKATRAKTWGEKNKIVTKAVYEAAKKALKKFAFTGVPPELITIAAYHVEAGARSFADFSKEMVKDFGRKVRPYLKAAYKAAQKKVGGTGYSTDKEIAAHLATDLDKDIKDVMKESGVQIRDLIRQHLSEAERTKEAITKALVDKLGLRESDAAAIAAKVEAEYNKLATQKKEQALKAIERRLLRKSPVRKTAEKKLIELTNLGAFKEDKFKEEYARAMGFPEITKENAAKIEELANKVQNAKEGRPKFNAIIELLNYQASLPGVDKMDLATSVWMASLLSGPTTQLKNIFANSYNMGALALNVAAQSPKDIPFLLRGLTIGLGNGLQEGGSTMITGQSPIKQSAAAQGILERTKFSPYNPFGYYKYVPRFMLAADAVTYGGLKEMRAYQLALSEARDKYPTQNAYQKAIEILAQTDAQLQSAQAEAEQEYQEVLAEIDADTSLNKVQKEAKKAAAKLDRSRRVYDIVEQNRPNQLVTEAHDFALRGTFNNPPDGALGMAARFFNGITHRVPAVRFFVPFVNVITNVANEYVNYSPLGYARAMKGGSITGNRKTFTEQDRKELMIKATIGTTAAIAAFVLSGIGGDDEEEPFFQITADGYNDYKKNKELEQTGWRPYSIKVGNRWISYKLMPMAAILAAVGALRDKERYGKEKLTENTLNYVVAPMQEFISTVAETSFLGSAETFLSGVLGATKGDKGQKLVEWASKTGGAAVPILGTNLYQQMAERVYDALDTPDKEYRGADGAIGIFAKMLRNVPVIRDEFQNAVNGLGEELPPQTGGVIFSKKEEGPHAKLWQLLADKKATTGRPDRRGAAYIDINGDEKAMNDEQFYFFAKTRGEYIRTLMERQYDRLKDMDEKEFGKWMESTRTSANRFANEELALQSEKGIYEKGIKKYKAEAQHEKDRLMYALERGDVKDVKFAFDNYEPLSQDGKGEDKRKIFVEIVKDDIMPSGVNSEDRVDFYKGVFLNKNLKIRVQEKQPNGKVKFVSKPFNEVFTEEERAEYKKKYMEKEEEVMRKLPVLDKALEKKYATKTSEEALWRKYLKMGVPKK